MIHSTNESCKRNGRRCTEYDQPIFEERAEDITAFIKKNAGKAAFMVSTGLEDDLSTSAYKKRVHILEEALPLDTFIVRNPNAKNYSSRGADVVELHGANRKYNKGSCAYSNDGFDINFSRERRAINNYLSLPGLLSELDRAKRNRCSSFIWWDTQGGQFNLDWGWNVPRSRNIYIYPKDVISVNKILRRYQ